MMIRTGKMVLPLCRVGTVFQRRCLSTPIFAVRPNHQSDTNQKHNKPRKHHLPYSTPLTPLDFQSRGLRLLQTPLEVQDSTAGDGDGDGLSEVPGKKSRNQIKREARKAVQWGMELSTFSPSQIKFILRVASLEDEVFDAIMLVKRFGPDVREGKRRQYNYIGRLLREAQPELMDDLIRATKDGDQIKLQELSSDGRSIIEEEETEFEEEEEGNYTAVASRWFSGLIDKDSDITNEVYSIHRVEFDRQELRKLVRRIHNIQSRQPTEENKKEIEAALVSAKNSMIRFLRSVAKQMESD